MRWTTWGVGLANVASLLTKRAVGVSGEVINVGLGFRV